MIMTNHQVGALRVSRLTVVAASVTAFALACNRAEPGATVAATSERAGAVYTVRDTTVDASFSAAGVAAPIQQATLSTKLMGTVMEVTAMEGDRIAGGQLLVRIDARDLSARSAQAAAAILEAEAVRGDAVTQTNRIRALYADSAAPRAQLDAAETGLARADAALRAARAAASELESVQSYSEIRAPFAGIVTRRFVDPGAFAAPGAPLVTVQDVTRLRVTASVTPDIARGLRRGDVLDATIEGQPVRATIEGVVPSTAGNLYAVNALVPNPRAAMLAGSAAMLELPAGSRHVIMVPAAAIVREGDLAGVILRTAQGDERRWVRMGRAAGTMVEVLAGLRAGDRVVIASSAAAAAPGN
jgi:RND family efflux transporter MFP subunit